MGSMNVLYVAVSIAGAALAVPVLIATFRFEKTGAMRIGLALVYAVTGAVMWTFSEDILPQVMSVSMAATGAGYVIYSAVRGAQPRGDSVHAKRPPDTP